jgi:hypothetical protein
MVIRWSRWRLWWGLFDGKREGQEKNIRELGKKIQNDLLFLIFVKVNILL